MKLFWPLIKISYGITVYNEIDELRRLTKVLVPNISPKDEIIILSDEENVTDEVLAEINTLLDTYKNIKHISFPLNKDFATYKNHLIEYAKGDYLFQIDADEIPNRALLKKLKFRLFLHYKYDCFFVPRVNYVEGITEEHIKSWDWTIDGKGRINYPDLQMRILKLGKGIEWKDKVHEKLVNWKKLKRLPYKENEDYCLYHIKQIEKQEKQNELYDNIGAICSSFFIINYICLM
ncbi:MAG: glycosyltransferase [Prevotella sp.]|jgi:hypothetical protein|nr:glycosyltransferase [Prevotella sp.]